MQTNLGASTYDQFFDSVPFIMEGTVVSTSDPDEMDRLKIWVPALDGERYEIEHLPWADYCSVFAGFTVQRPAGSRATKNDGQVPYGFKSIPKVGATVFVFCLNGDPARRVYFGGLNRWHRNRSLPYGRNKNASGDIGPWSDDESPLQPAYDNLREQFNDKVTAPEALTRGTYERQGAQARTIKDDGEGYSLSPDDEPYLDPQTSYWVTPGHNGIVIQDDPRFGRVRIKTADGHQVIFDDANERIYLSTAKGKTWIELDLDGHVHIFGSESISLRAGKDFNVRADRNINLEAGEAVNIKAVNSTIMLSSKDAQHFKSTSSVFISACGDIHLNAEANNNITAAQVVNIRGGSAIIESAGVIHLNGPAAAEADCADAASEPPIIPGHEPWKRPASAIPRGPNWNL